MHKLGPKGDIAFLFPFIGLLELSLGGIGSLRGHDCSWLEVP
jgi:hypothetical protein